MTHQLTFISCNLIFLRTSLQVGDIYRNVHTNISQMNYNTDTTKMSLSISIEANSEVRPISAVLAKFFNLI